MSQSNDVKSASRVIHILELLSHHSDGLTFSQILNRTSIPKSSLSALLSTIERDRWIEFNQVTKQYRSGMRAWETSQRFVRNLKIAESAEDHLIELRNLLNMTVHLAIRDGRDVVYVSQLKADTASQLPSFVGGRLPANATALGKSLLTGLTDGELARLYDKVQMQKFTNYTVNEIKALSKVVEASRKNGFSEAHGDFKENIFCVASPIHNSKNQVIASISCTIPKSNLDSFGKMADRMRELVVAQAGEISQEISQTA